MHMNSCLYKERTITIKMRLLCFIEKTNMYYTNNAAKMNIRNHQYYIDTATYSGIQ